MAPSPLLLVTVSFSQGWTTTLRSHTQFQWPCRSGRLCWVGPSQPPPSSLHLVDTSPPLVTLLAEDEAEQDGWHKQEQHRHDHDDHHPVVLHRLWGGRGQWSLKSSGPRRHSLRGSRGPPITHLTLVHPAVTLCCRHEWQVGY